MRSAFQTKLNEGTAKNVILFIGDGMGPNTVTTSRIYGKGESGYLAFEKFPHIGVLKVASHSLLTIPILLLCKITYSRLIPRTNTYQIHVVQPQHFFVVLKQIKKPLVLMQLLHFKIVMHR